MELWNWQLLTLTSCPAGPRQGQWMVCRFDAMVGIKVILPTSDPYLMSHIDSIGYEYWVLILVVINTKV